MILLALLSFLLGIGALALVTYFGKHQGRGFRPFEELVVVTNLDAIKSRTIGFRFNGKIHRINPLSVDKYVEATFAMAGIADMIASKKRLKSESQLLDAYEAIFSILCPSVKRADLNEMSVQQIGALYNTVLEQIMGREQFEAQKKSQSLAEQAPRAKTNRLSR